MKYDSDRYYKWYVKLPDISLGYKNIAEIKHKKAVFYWSSSYYFWIFFLIASVLTITNNIILGVVSVLASPFIVAGYIYSLCYFEDWIIKIKSAITR